MAFEADLHGAVLRKVLGMGRDDVRALALDLAAVEVEVDGSLGEQAFHRTGGLGALIRRRGADTRRIRTGVLAGIRAGIRIRLGLLGTTAGNSQRRRQNDGQQHKRFTHYFRSHIPTADAAGRFLSQTMGPPHRRYESRESPMSDKPRAIERTDPTQVPAPGPDRSSIAAP